MVDHQWGVDKSHFDAPTGTAQLISEGFTFQTHKIGGDANDSEAAAWWSDSKSHRDQMLLGGYWVLYPGHGASAGDAFADRLDAVCPGWGDTPFILQLDCEIWGGDTSTKPGLADIRACANRLRQRAPKLMPIVYAPRWAYNNELSGLGFPLWSSAYVGGGGSASGLYPGDSYTGWAAYSGIVPTIAQFSSTATAAGDSTSDVNAFKGSLAQLAQIVAPGWEINVDWSDPNVLATNFFFAEANRAITGGATGTSQADVNARNAKVYVTGIIQPMVTAARNAVTDAVAAALGQTLTAIAAVPTASVDVAALAAALNPLIDDVDITAEVVEQAFRDLINGTAPAATPAAAEASGLPVYDAAADALTQRQRESRQGDIAGGGNDS